MLLLLTLSLTALVSGAASASDSCTDCETPNVRTALFRQTDLVKECWSDEELALLYARRLVQELIPRKVTCNIPVLLEYIVMVLETAKSIACSARSHRILLMAIADGFGGYLQAYGLPQTKSKYYEGSLSYCTAHQMNEVQTELRRALGTDGGGWTRPVYVRRSSCCAKPYKVRTLERAVCNNLVSATQPTSVCKTGYREGVDPGAPLPFLDDPRQPHAIAVPFKDKSLYSLFSRNASDLLLKYYSIVLTCIGPPNLAACTDSSYNQKIESFVVSYHAWLSRAILPHLHDEIWYPAFGGVYSILQEMETRGLITQDISYSENNDEDFALQPIENNECPQPSDFFFNMWIVFAIFLVFWIIVCNLCCLLKYCGRNNEYDYPCSPTTSSSGAVVNSLVAMYCCEKDDLDGTGQLSKDSD